MTLDGLFGVGRKSCKALFLETNDVWGPGTDLSIPPAGKRGGPLGQIVERERRGVVRREREP